jgi:hypothetical protein
MITTHELNQSDLEEAVALLMHKKGFTTKRVTFSFSDNDPGDPRGGGERVICCKAVTNPIEGTKGKRSALIKTTNVKD